MNRICDLQEKPREYKSLLSVIKDAFCDAERGFVVSIVAPDEMAGDIVSNILGVYDLKLAYVNYDPYDYSGEYCIALQKNANEETELWCEPVYHEYPNNEAKAYESECDVLYIQDECDVDILSHVDCGSKIIFQVKGQAGQKRW